MTGCCPVLKREILKEYGMMMQLEHTFLEKPTIKSTYKRTLMQLFPSFLNWNIVDFKRCVSLNLYIHFCSVSAFGMQECPTEFQMLETFSILI